MPADGRRLSACSTARASPTAPPRRSSCGPRTRTSTPTSRCTSRRSRSSPGNGSGNADPAYDYTHFPEIGKAAAGRLRAGRRHRPALADRDGRGARLLHAGRAADLRDLGFAERGTAWKEVLAGTFDLDGDLPVNPDGGLKSFGHPVGASGLRMYLRELAPAARARPPRSAGSRPPTAASASSTTSAATPARWSASSASSAPSSGSGRTTRRGAAGHPALRRRPLAVLPPPCASGHEAADRAGRAQPDVR